MRRPPVRKAQPRPSAVVGDPVKTGDSARWRPHVIAVPFLLLLAVVVWRLQTPASVLDLNTDMHAICSIVAAQQDPARYASDHLLSHPARFARYTPAYVWLVGVTVRLAGGFPEAAGLLVLPTSALFMVGSYLLLWRLTGRPALAVGVTVAFAFGRIWFQLGEKWSMSEVWGTMPRTQFTLFLPWLVLAVWECRGRPKLWPLVAAFAAGLVYVHPVSAPAWGLAVWVMFVLGPGSGVRIRQRLIWGALSALAAGVVAIPALKDQLLPRVRAPQAAAAKNPTGQQEQAKQQEYLLKLSKARFSPGLMDLREGFNLVGNDFIGPHKWLALWGILWAVTGAAVGFRDRMTRQGLLALLIGLAAFGLLTVLVPLVDSIQANNGGRRPEWYDLARGIRFWPFWLLLIGAAGFGAWRKTSHATLRWLLPLVAVPTVWAAWWGPIVQGAGRLFPGETSHHAELTTAVAETVAFIRNKTPANAAFVADDDDIWLRHTPGRPLVHSWKEGSTLSYNYVQARAWAKRMDQEANLLGRDRQLLGRQQQLAGAKLPQDEARRQWQAIQADKLELWNRKLTVWSEWGAQYVLQPAWTKPPLPIEFENRYWFIARIPR